MATINLSTLPDICILNIFRTISLSDQILHIQLVCRRWRLLHHETSRQIKSLVLVGPHNSTGSYHSTHWRRNNYKLFLSKYVQTSSDMITFKHQNTHLLLASNNCLSASLCEHFLNKFPQILSLDLVHICLEQEIVGVRLLLDGWKDKLAELNVYYRNFATIARGLYVFLHLGAVFRPVKTLANCLKVRAIHRVRAIVAKLRYISQEHKDDGRKIKPRLQSPRALHQLMAQVSSLAQLERFTLYDKSIATEKRQPNYSADLSQLRELHLFAHHDINKPLMESIFRDDVCFDRIRRLTLSGFLVRHNPQVVSRLARLLFAQLSHLTVHGECAELVNQHCTPNLKYLHLNCLQTPLDALPNLVSRLVAHLCHLRVEFMDSFTGIGFLNKSKQAFWSRSRIYSETALPFTTIHTLHLCASSLLHNHVTTTACSVIARTFPNLRNLILDGNLSYGQEYSGTAEGGQTGNIRKNCVPCAEHTTLSIYHAASLGCKLKLVKALLDNNRHLEKIYFEVEPCTITYKQRFEVYCCASDCESQWKIVTLKKL